VRECCAACCDCNCQRQPTYEHKNANV
jgi:hypothetical protein